ncbi:transcriptional regulator [Desulfitobacterium dichloroeliminans LMG P-21439]|uniref:Transcriptional regulator n=1 Tax=Desulfitobacterium dichloroeliminans (strain LMG P-21439 / DCA1) TaxID=871963 RepID=L0FDC7_DESDL|nr:TetR/AcrR family transcriptional regulator [Desulfitobacterium dichloroeliminans]AGA70646.1 transcriptional regulator [Desulfitobacterium dichloroeliminans LMG P-21439]
MAKEEKRLEILKAALKVISEMGFEGAKMEDIAKGAGVGKGTIYEYFESKNTLFTEMVHSCTKLFQDGLADTLADGKNLEEKIRNLSAHNAHFIASHALLFNAPVAHQSFPEETKEQIKKDWNAFFATIEEEVGKAMLSQEIRSDLDPEMITAIIIGGLNQYSVKKLFGDNLTPEEINHAGIAQLMIAGLKQ